MTNFGIILVVVWSLTVGAWWIASRSRKQSDAAQIRKRVSGGSRSDTRGSDKKQSARLIASEDAPNSRWVTQFLHRYQLQDRLKTLIEQAGLKWSPVRLIHGCLALTLATLAVGILFVPAAFRIALIPPALIVGSLPILRVMRLRARRLRKFEEIFPESLEFVARSMRAGHAFSVSLEMLHKEFQEPLAGEFRRTFEEHNLGLPLDSALQKLAQRVPSLDVHFFVSAVLLQKRTGGNLAEILDKLAYVIRERFKLRGKIRAISAHGRITGLSLSCIPLAVAGIMFVVNPDYVTFFAQDEVGNYMAGGAVLLQMLGYGIIKKIVNIEV